MVMRDTDALDDFDVLGAKLVSVVKALADPLLRASGSDAAALARTRRMLGKRVVERVAELEADYELLGEALGLSWGSGAAAVAQERRMIRKTLDTLVAPEGVSKVAQLESYRAARAADSGVASRRHKSGRGARSG